MSAWSRLECPGNGSSVTLSVEEHEIPRTLPQRNRDTSEFCGKLLCTKISISEVLCAKLGTKVVDHFHRRFVSPNCTLEHCGNLLSNPPENQCSGKWSIAGREHQQSQYRRLQDCSMHTAASRCSSMFGPAACNAAGPCWRATCRN